jgi:PAS domain S-box-containing protein
MEAPGSHALYEGAACGLLLTSPDGTIRRANATFCSWVGFASEELVDIRRMQDMLTVGGRIFHHTHLAPLLQMQGSVSEVKLDIVHRDGQTIPVLVNVIRRGHGGVHYDEVAVTVATDRQKYEHELMLARRAAECANERLAKDDRRKDEFLAILAHELRGPLAPMSNVLGMLRTKDIADPQVRWAHEVLDRQLAHITRLVDDLLDVARITEGKVRLQRAPVSFNEPIQRALEAAMPLITAANQELTVVLEEAPLWLNADLVRVTQVVLNLLVNASKFTSPGGSIQISTQREGSLAVCAIRDSGIGIDKQHLATVFEMFSQAEPAVERTTGGLGIGLALVKGLVELHGGTVTAASPGLGAGSRFEIRLPLLEAPLPGGTDVARRPPDATRRKILIVDDNVDSAESIAVLLAMEGHDARIAHDGESALEAVGQGDVEVVLLDLGLPGLSGFEVARRLRGTAEGRDLLLIAATGWGQQKDVEASAKAGFDHHLVKPIDLEALAVILGLPPS